MTKQNGTSALFGNTFTTKEICGLRLTEKSYLPGLKTPRHCHDRSLFCLILRGAYSQTYRKTTLACKPLTILFRPAGEVHSDRFHKTGARCFIIEIESRWLNRLLEYQIVLDKPADFH